MPSAAFRRHLPNTLTLSRLVIAATFFTVLSLWPGGTQQDATRWLLPAAILFVIAAVTDALDGYFARRWNVVSQFGRVMDPFADKVLVLGAIVFLAGPDFRFATEGGTGFQASGVSPWIATVILAREILVTSIRSVAEGAGVSFPATWSGKLKMILQSIVVPMILLILALTDVTPGSTWLGVIHVLVWATLLVTVWSGWPYLRRGLVALGRPENP